MLGTRSRLTPYLFVAPLVLLMLFVFGYPLLRILDFSFRQVRGVSGPWIGVRNYRLVLGQPLFQDSVLHNIQLLVGVPIIIAISLIVAVILYGQIRAWRTYRAVVFVPYVLSVPIVAVVLKVVFQFNGPFNEVLRAGRLDAFALDWIGSSALALWTVLGVITWRELGFGIVLMLAGLLTLDENVLEAAEVDGANWWQRLRHVVLPQMAPIVEFYIVILVITMLAAVFSYIYMISSGRGGPGTATMVTELYVFNSLFRNSLPGVASAVAVMLFLASAVAIIALFRLRRRSEVA
jgi:ABC-type sugar transport system permease subunit